MPILPLSLINCHNWPIKGRNIYHSHLHNYQNLKTKEVFEVVIVYIQVGTTKGKRNALGITTLGLQQQQQQQQHQQHQKIIRSQIERTTCNVSL